MVATWHDVPRLEVAEELAKDGISVEIVDPRTLRPMDTETIIGSVRKTHRAVVLEAGAGFAGMGSEIAAQITETAFDDLDAPVLRVTGENAPMPYAKNLELLKTPSKAKIAAAIRQGAAHDHEGIHAQLSDAMETGKVIKWLKKEGDAVRAVNSRGGRDDKANVEIEAFGAGILRKIVVGEGGRCGGRDDRRHRGPDEDISSMASGSPRSRARGDPSPHRLRPRERDGSCEGATVRDGYHGGGAAGPHRARSPGPAVAAVPRGRPGEGLAARPARSRARPAGPE